MNARLRREILTETYKDMQKLISATVRRFWNSYGGDLDDLHAQANLIFINAVDDYDSSRAKMTTWLTIRIRNGLLDYIKGEYKSKHLLIEDLLADGITPDFIESKSKIKKDFSVMELIDNLEQDAHIVLWLFLTTPKEVMQDILDSKKRVDGVRSCMRNRLNNRLRQMGWTIRRIKEAFDEVKNVTSY